MDFPNSFQVGNLTLAVILSHDRQHLFVSYYDKLTEDDYDIWTVKTEFIYPELGGLEAYRTYIENALKARLIDIYQYAKSLQEWVAELKGAMDANAKD